MSLWQIAEDEYFLRRNNRIVRWLARTLPAEVFVAGEDKDTGTEILILKYNGWSVELDYLNTDEDSFDWCGERGTDREGSSCRNTTHLLNSIRKHCR